LPFTGYAGANPLSIAVPGCGGSGSLGVQSTDCSIGLIQSAINTFTPAQIQGMNATPLTLVPAPGAGLSIIVDWIAFKYIYAGTVFASGGAISFQYSGGASVTTTVPAATLTTAASATIAVGNLAADVTAVINTAVTMTNATGAFTGGTGASVIVSVSYVII
jgi:hypothetical protein